MKKYIALSLALLAMSAVANNESKASNAIDATKPTITTGIFKEIDGKLQPLKGNTISRSAENMHMCWFAFNLPLSADKNVTEEYFYAPEGFKVENDQSKITFDQATNVLLVRTENVKSSKNENMEYVQSCWQFDHKDPIGKYEVQIKVNDTVFPVHAFEIIK